MQQLACYRIFLQFMINSYSQIPKWSRFSPLLEDYLSLSFISTSVDCIIDGTIDSIQKCAQLAYGNTTSGIFLYHESRSDEFAMTTKVIQSCPATLQSKIPQQRKRLIVPQLMIVK